MHSTKERACMYGISNLGWIERQVNKAVGFGVGIDNVS
jgi:hypothetical protein